MSSRVTLTVISPPSIDALREVPVSDIRRTVFESLESETESGPVGTVRPSALAVLSREQSGLVEVLDRQIGVSAAVSAAYFFFSLHAAVQRLRQLPTLPPTFCGVQRTCW